MCMSTVEICFLWDLVNHFFLLSAFIELSECSSTFVYVHSVTMRLRCDMYDKNKYHQDSTKSDCIVGSENGKKGNCGLHK